MLRILPSAFSFLILLLGIDVPSGAQTISLGSDSANVISHDSTGYGHFHPLDIPDDTGLFIYSKDGAEALRIYGSFRLLLVLDERQQFQAYGIDPPMIPAGDDDFENYNATWTTNMSRLGIDVLLGTGIGTGLLVRFELDWKGTTEKFRVRHLFMRSQNWIVGFTWNGFTTLAYLPQTVAGHMTGAVSGRRTPQFTYYNEQNNWKYQLGLEYNTASLIKPDTLGAVSRVIFPALVGQFSYAGDWGQVGMGAMLKPNRVQFTGGDKRAESILGYGAMIAAKFNIKKKNRIMFSGYKGSGMGSYIVDYTFAVIELVYNPQTTEFENMDLYGGFLAYEHDWSQAWLSTFGGAYNHAINKSFQGDLAFNYSYKSMVNLFYRPISKMKGFVVGAEILYTERFNKNNTSNKALRASLLMYYDF